MNISSSLLLFLGSSVLVSCASLLMMKKLEKLAIRLHFSQALLGMLVALGANSPEITSSIFSIYMKQHEIGFGIIIGSNIINLAGLLGIGAVIAGQIKIKIPSLILNGAISFLTTLIITLFILNTISIVWAASILFALFFFYVFLISKRKFKTRIGVFLRQMVKESNQNIQVSKIERFEFIDALLLGGSLALIVAGSAGLVFSAIELAEAWGISHAIVGTLILAGLTSIPNIIMAVFLAEKHLGSAVVSETFNSNILNFMTGICVPVLLFGEGRISTKVEFSTFWLLGMTILVIGGLSFRKGFRRLGGVSIIALYVCYVFIMIFW